MSLKTKRYWFLLGWFPACIAAAGTETANATARAVSSVDMMSWSMGLLIVLGVFFLCVWGLRKAAAFGGIRNAEKMRVLGGVALGMREKVVLLQVGKKQLILGVTPGRIETLHVLEGEDCLLKEEIAPSNVEAGFAHALKQLRQGRSDA
jgi:flagellar protein FliO/FliZ